MSRAADTSRTTLSMLRAGIAAVVLAGAMSWTQLPALADLGEAPNGPEAYLGPAASDTVAGADRTVSNLRAAIPGGSYATRVRALFALNGLDVPETPLPSPSWEVLRSVSELPGPLRVPVAGLAAAVQRATDELGPLPKPVVERSLSRLFQHLGSLPARARKAPVLHSMSPPGSDARPDVVRDFPGLMPGVDALAPAARRALEQNPSVVLLLAEALDAYLPAITSFSGVHHRSVLAASGCDLADLTPQLCVGSELDNTYEKSSALLVDFGGNDTYTNTAGGAPFLPPGSPVYLPLSLNVDIGGNDRYDSQPVVPVDRVNEIIGEGAGMVGAVGILVDLTGNDRYETTTPVPQSIAQVPPLPQSYSVVQGTGAYGTGLLFDQAGDDTYSAFDRGHDSVVSSGLLAQGMGAAGNASGCTLYASTGPPLYGHPSCSLGALVDLGRGDDDYLIDATQDGAKPEFFRTAIGQGMGENVAGVLFDDGGTDGFSIEARQGATGDTGLFGIPTTIPIGQGWGAGGFAALIEGEGDTTYRIEALQRGLAWSYEVGGQGFGLAEGTGVLDDRGGDDEYTTRADLPQSFTWNIDDSCVQANGSVCPRAKKTWIGNVGGPLTEVHAQGLGQGIGATGFLHDHGGDDDYTADSEAHLDISLEDRLTQPQAPAHLDVISFSAPLLWAQGFATSSSSSGVLLDEDGSDTYTATQLNETRGSAISEHTEATVTAFSQSQTFVGAQGASIIGGTGALLDLGGATDRFVAEADNPVRTSTGEGAYHWSGYWPPFQGMGARGVFVALGDEPRVSASPRNGVSPHSPNLHGAGTWLYDQPVTFSGSAPGADADHQVYDQAGTNALGHVPEAQASTTTVTFLETPASGSTAERLPVAARVTDEGGRPIPGVQVRFGLQYGGNITTPGFEEYESWNNALEAVGVTDDQGIARTPLPLNVSLAFDAMLDQTFYIGDIGLYGFRLLATFDGGPGVYASHANRPFELTAA